MKDPFKDKKFNKRLYLHRGNSSSAELCIWHKKGRKKRSPYLLIKCGDCKNKFEIYYDEDGLEIAGVNGSIENWREILLPLLKKADTGLPKITIKPERMEYLEIGAAIGKPREIKKGEGTE